MQRNGYYPMEPHVVRTIRAADTLTGKVCDEPHHEIISYLIINRLVDDDRYHLNTRGMAVRRWLYIGAQHAPTEVEKTLN